MRKGFLVMLMLFLGLGSMKAQMEVTIGSGSTTNSNLPTYELYNYSLSQQIYTAEEIGVGGLINSISFNYAATVSATRNLTIYMKHTTMSSMTNGTTWESVTAADQVFAGNVIYPAASGWFTITLDAPFAYNGTDNLMICVDDNTGDWVGSKAFYVYTTNRSKSIYSDGTNYNPMSASAYSGTVRNANNQIKLDILAAAAPIITVNPNPIHMGFRPNNAWMRPFEVSVSNAGLPANIAAIDVNNAYYTVSEMEFPMALSFGDNIDFTVSTGLAAAGDVNATLVVAYGERAVDMIDLTATAYDPISPDVFEMAEVATAFPLTRNFTAATAIYDNYLLPGVNADGRDVVYKVTFANDMAFNAAVTAGDNAKVAVYAENFGGQQGPSTDNAIAFADGSLNDLTLAAGTYYVVASSTSDDFTVEINPTAIPAPEAPTCVAPVDGEAGVTSPVTLEWVLGNYTTEYQLVMGTSYPPTEVMVDWTSDLAESFTTGALLNNTTYFWRVNERNSTATTNGDVWGFTTTLNIPQNLVADDTELYEGEDVNFSWTAVQDRADRSFRGYNIYQDGVKLNANILSVLTYNVAGLAYNMVPGYTFNVTAVYDEGESNYSNSVVVYVTGEGNVSGIVYEQDSVTPIEGATISFRGEDEFGEEQAYSFTTGANGSYTGAMYAGVYTAVATADGYQDVIYPEDVTIVYNEMTPNIDFVMDETFAPVGIVVAEEMDENMVKVYWGMQGTAATIIEDFETGDFGAFAWENGSSYPWTITTTNPYEGTYCMKSTCEGVNSGVSSIEITMDIDRDALMSFYGKVSSENNYDMAKFYIDGAQQGAWSGAGNWANREFHVTEGTHTFKWSYEKDSSVSSNDDCFYVDYINFCYDPEPFGGEAWLYYDDGTNVDAVGLTAGGSLYWGVMFPAAELGQYAGTNLTKVSYFDYSAHTGNILIYQGGASTPGTLVHTQPYTATGSSQYVEFNLTSAIPVDPTQNLWIVMNNNNGQYVASACANTGNPNGRWISVDGIAWDDVAALGLDYTWNLRGFVTTGRGATCVLANDRVVKTTAVNYVGKSTPNGVLTNDPNAVVTNGAQAPTTKDRSFQYYNVWRTGCYNTEYTEENTVLLASHVTDTLYMDMSWANAQPGVYKWGVSRVYEGNRGTRDEVTYSFDDGTMQGWTNIDADGDGYAFEQSSDLSGLENQGHNGSLNYMLSRSYVNNVGPLTPDNYFVSPQVTVGNGASISFYACGQDAAYAGEHYGVAVSTTGNTSASDFTTIWEETLTAKSGNAGKGARGTRDQGAWYLKTVDLSAYAGQTIYVAIRHFNCTDNFYLDIDDITINSGNNAGGSNSSVIGPRESEIVWSECIDKDMFTTVDVTVSTNSGDAPTGATVTLTSTSEPEMGYDYTVTLDETGYYAWDEFRKGTYLCTIALEGFTGCYTAESMDIWDATSISCTLNEIIEGVEDLYTSHTGWAMWKGATSVTPPTPPTPPTPGDMATIILEAHDVWGDGTGYQILFDQDCNTSAAISGNFSCGQSYGEYEYMLPENATASDENVVVDGSLTMEIPAGTYDYVVLNPGCASFGVVYVASDQCDPSVGDHVTFEAGQVYHFTATLVSPNDCITITNGRGEIAGLNNAAPRSAEFAAAAKVADESLVNNKRANDSRSIEEYKVMLDGVFEGNTTNNFFQHDVTNLVPGQEYTTQVAAVYSTGMSDWSEYTWVYQPCEDYAGTVDGVTGEWDNENVVLSWEYPGSVTPPTPPTPGEMATIILEAHDVWGDGTGYQILFDQDCNTSAAISGNFSCGQSYGEYEYMLPENATASDENVVVDGSLTMEIPAGTYDYVVLNPGCAGFGVVYVASDQCDPSVGDHVTFEAGQVYHFTATLVSPNDCITITNGRGEIAGLNNAAPRSAEFEAAAKVADESLVMNKKPSDGGKAGRSVLFQQNEIITHAGQGANGADASAICGESAGAANFGPNANWALGNGTYYLVADDFTLDAASTITNMKFYAYQTGSGNNSTMTGLYMQIYDGDPMNGGQVVWGDNATNLLSATSFTNIYRVSVQYTGLTDVNRPIMALDANDLNISLEAGTYWVSVGFTGSLTSGPWAVPVSVWDESASGNGIQKIDTGWQLWMDAGQKGLPMIIEGTTGAVPPTPTGDVLGAVIFRDGEYLGFTEETTFTDLAPEAIAHNYCVRVVYDGAMDGAYYSMSCPECVDVEAPANTCEAPELLNGTYQWNASDDFGALISWGEQVEPVSEWLYYDNGTYSSSVGAGGTVYWGIKFEASDLANYAGCSMTEVSLYDAYAGTYVLNVYYGGAAAPQTLVHTQNFTLTGANDWFSAQLSSALPIDATQPLWITFYNTGVTYPAAGSNFTGNNNGAMVSIDGMEWMDISTASGGSLSYTWMIRGYVTNAAKGGEVVALPAFEGGKSESGLSAINVEPRQTMAPATRALDLESYKVYRSTTNGNYELIATVPAVAGQSYYEYYDEVEIGTYYYQVTAYYTGTNGDCESEPAMSELNPSNNYVIVNVTSVGEGANEARLYPNPTNGNVTIEAAGMNHITVVSALGQVVYDSEINSDNVVLNMAQYNAGVYMVRIATENGVSVKRVTVVR